MARAAAVFVVLFLAWAFCLIRPDGAGAATRPNFVLIQLDDFANLHFDSRWVDSSGVTRRSMPLTRQGLLSQGIRFTRYLTPDPICSPSRASLLSGRYQENHGVIRNGGEKGGWIGYRNNRIKDQNIATWLRGAGYRTMYFGKFLNKYEQPDRYPTPDVPPGWDVWQADATDDSTRDFYGYFLNIDGQVGGPFGPSGYWPGVEKDPVGCPDLGLGECEYHTDAITARAIEGIESTPGDQPLLAKLSFHTPHGDFWPPVGPEPAMRHYDTALGTPRPRPAGYGERDVSDKPPWVRSLARPDKRTGDSIREEFQKSIEALRSVDDSVGRVLDALRRTGRLGNTFVFFFSDNGFFHGEHRIARGKSHPYEPALQVPMLVRGPGIPKGKRSSELVANHDVAPTILSLARVRAGAKVDGRPMTPFWERPDRLSRRPILISSMSDLTNGTVPRGGEPFYRGVRLGPYKFIHYEGGFLELYDLGRDPAELENRASDPDYRKVMRYMKGQLKRYWGCSGSECRVPAPKWPVPERRPAAPSRLLDRDQGVARGDRIADRDR